VPIILKSGSLNLLEPSGLVQACNGIALLFSTVACVIVQFRLARMERRYITLSTNRDIEYSHELPVENSSVLLVVVYKRWSLGRQQVVPQMNEDFGPCTDRHIFCTTQGG